MTQAPINAVYNTTVNTRAASHNENEGDETDGSFGINWLNRG
jgi:hypothetical protein